MKKLLLILVLLLSFGYSQKAMAYSFWAVNSQGDTIYYNFIYGSDSTVKVTYEGYYDNRMFYHGYRYFSEHIVIPSTVTYNEKTYIVSVIGSRAFENSRMLTITLPPTITSIDDNAFLNCTKLHSINLPPNAPPQIKIEGCAFYHCDNLKYVNIPNSVISIGSSAFEYCLKIAMLILGENIYEIGQSAFETYYNPLIISYAKTPPIIQDKSFYPIETTSILVNCESLEAYKSTPYWSEFDYKSCIGLEDIVKENIDFTVYPNPAKDNITISTKQLEGGILSLYDIMGKEILRRRINNDETILDINRLKAGVYILKVLNSENIIAGNKKIIKQ